MKIQTADMNLETYCLLSLTLFSYKDTLFFTFTKWDWIKNEWINSFHKCFNLFVLYEYFFCQI